MNGELVNVLRFHSAEIGIVQEEGYITFTPRYWHQLGQNKMELRPGMCYQIRSGHLDDLIAHLQQARLDLGTPTQAVPPQLLND